MPPATELTSDLLYCRHKAHLILGGATGELAPYAVLQRELDGEYQCNAVERLVQQHEGCAVVRPGSLKHAVRHGGDLFLDAPCETALGPETFPAVECIRDPTGRAIELVPISFSRSERAATETPLLLTAAGGAIVGAIASLTVAETFKLLVKIEENTRGPKDSSVASVAD